MKLIICGNGLDLHHKLKTSYSSYKDFLKQNYGRAVTDFERFPYINIKDTEKWIV